MGRWDADFECAWSYGDGEGAAGVDDVAVELAGLVAVAGDGDVGAAKDFSVVDVSVAAYYAPREGDPVAQGAGCEDRDVELSAVG